MELLQRLADEQSVGQLEGGAGKKTQPKVGKRYVSELILYTSDDGQTQLHLRAESGSIGTHR